MFLYTVAIHVYCGYCIFVAKFLYGMFLLQRIVSRDLFYLLYIFTVINFKHIFIFSYTYFLLTAVVLHLTTTTLQRPDTLFQIFTQIFRAALFQVQAEQDLLIKLVSTTFTPKNAHLHTVLAYSCSSMHKDGDIL